MQDCAVFLYSFLFLMVYLWVISHFRIGPSHLHGACSLALQDPPDPKSPAFAWTPQVLASPYGHLSKQKTSKNHRFLDVWGLFFLEPKGFFSTLFWPVCPHRLGVSWVFLSMVSKPTARVTQRVMKTKIFPEIRCFCFGSSGSKREPQGFYLPLL